MNRVRGVRPINHRKVMAEIDMEEVAEAIMEIAQEEPREITDKIESVEGTTLDFRGAQPRRKTNQPLKVRCPSRRAI